MAPLTAGCACRLAESTTLLCVNVWFGLLSRAPFTSLKCLFSCTLMIICLLEARDWHGKWRGWRCSICEGQGS